MKIPVIKGIIDRRILANYRVDPDVLADVLPAPFRPKLVHGFGIAGICLIRLKHIRPRFVPDFLGISSENVAHRIAVEWEQDGQIKEGVYIPRRDTSSRLNSLAGGRLFPGVHHHARFEVHEDADRYSVIMDGDDDVTHVAVVGRVGSALPPGSIFSSLEEVSNFFEKGSLGYSATSKTGSFDGLELRTFNWQVMPLEVERVESSFFENEELFPDGSVQFDCALLMRGIEHEWHPVEESEASAGRLDRGKHVEHIEVLMHVHVTRSDSYGDHCGWLLSDEEPDALMCARPGLWEPWRVTARDTRPASSKRFFQGAAVSNLEQDL